MPFACPHCRTPLTDAALAAGRCPRCDGMFPTPVPSPQSAVPHDGLSLTSYACPAALVLTMLLVVVFCIGYRIFDAGLTPYERQNAALRTAKYPVPMTLLGIFTAGFALLGMVGTVAVFIVAFIRGHRTATIVSLVTFAASFPLLFCIWFGLLV